MKKVCTNITESKRLRDLNLHPDTADMFYLALDTMDDNDSYRSWPDVIRDEEPDGLPAWSQKALSDLLPCIISVNEHESYLLDMWKRLDNSWKIAYRLGDNEYISFSGDSFEITYNMVVWCLERNFLDI